jgi:lipopolysaccharide transport system ATP-binding protein
MDYLDRKTDVIILKVSHRRTLGSGIAALPSTARVEKL